MVMKQAQAGWKKNSSDNFSISNLEVRKMIEMEAERRKLVGQVVEIGEGQRSRFRSFPNSKKT